VYLCLYVHAYAHSTHRELLGISSPKLSGLEGAVLVRNQVQCFVSGLKFVRVTIGLVQGATATEPPPCGFH
jgi:hypothetical protein